MTSDIRFETSYNLIYIYYNIIHICYKSKGFLHNLAEEIFYLIFDLIQYILYIYNKCF